MALARLTTSPLGGFRGVLRGIPTYTGAGRSLLDIGPNSAKEPRVRGERV
jgi:hypothetical protein